MNQYSQFDFPKSELILCHNSTVTIKDKAIFQVYFVVYWIN